MKTILVSEVLFENIFISLKMKGLNKEQSDSSLRSE